MPPVKHILTAAVAAFVCVHGLSAAPAQYSFEGNIPPAVKVRGRGETSLSSDRFKDGSTSLRFSWVGQTELIIADPSAIQVSLAAPKGGLMFWVCSETPMKSPVRVAVKDAAGAEICGVDVNMDFKGWRALWVRYEDMGEGAGLYGNRPFSDRRKDGAYLSIRPAANVVSGTFFIDRLTFSGEAINAQNCPDAQYPKNNSFLTRRNMWHWCRLWEWEQYPLLEEKQPDAHKVASLRQLEKNLDAYFGALPGMPSNYDPVAARPSQEKKFRNMGLVRLSDGTVKGSPIVSNDESLSSDTRIQAAFDLYKVYAVDFALTSDRTARERFFLIADHLIYQGVAWGSGMGTNHHYGYSIRGWIEGIWLMREEIRKEGKMPEYLAALSYWSGLAECRLPYEKDRDEIIDSWNTLLMPKLTAAMLQDTDAGKYTCMEALTDWTGRSMEYSNGTLGGFKADGTAFHHGGNYPAYAIGGFSTLGTYLSLVLDTDFMVGEQARRSFKNALLSMRNYCNHKDWGIGISGRHPFNGSIPAKVVEAFGVLALAGDLTGGEAAVDPELAGAYLALGGKDTRVVSRLKKEKIKASKAPEGFFVYNYGAFGVHRRKGWMLTLKGYNTDVWGSEIYAANNRFGRYQSYGSAQIINSGAPAGNESSRYREAGWDWNRLPGTTTIHLPFEKLNSPLKGTLMERNTSRFPGVSSLEGRNGILAFTYVEKDRDNFCKGATATKSVFCFDNRIVFIGTGISNDSEYPTETTLFQQSLDSESEAILADGQLVNAFPLDRKYSPGEVKMLEDLRGNCYILKDSGNLRVYRQMQTSPDNTMKKTGKGPFVTAVLEHGISPSDAGYEYLVLVEPAASERSRYSRKLPYTVIRADSDAHVVRDNETGITGYVSYKGYSATSAESSSTPSGKGQSPTRVREIEAETIVMERETGEGELVISICTPDLGISDKSYTTPEQSSPLERVVKISGSYTLGSPYEDDVFGTGAEVHSGEDTTEIRVRCRHGRPVELHLKHK